MEFFPLDDRIMVELEEAEEKSEGGIYIPETAKEKPLRGKVVAVGSGKLLTSGQRHAMCVQKGERVLFGKYSGTELKYDGKEYKILKESEVLAKFTSAEPNNGVASKETPKETPKDASNKDSSGKNASGKKSNKH